MTHSRGRTEWERLLLWSGASAVYLAAVAALAPWKLDLAAELRRRTAAPYRWIAENVSILLSTNSPMSTQVFSSFGPLTDQATSFSTMVLRSSYSSNPSSYPRLME